MDKEGAKAEGGTLAPRGVTALKYLTGPHRHRVTFVDAPKLQTAKEEMMHLNASTSDATMIHYKTDFN